MSTVAVGYVTFPSRWQSQQKVSQATENLLTLRPAWHLRNIPQKTTECTLFQDRESGQGGRRGEGKGWEQRVDVVDGAEIGEEPGGGPSAQTQNHSRTCSLAQPRVCVCGFPK